jgi:hypothetical protein
MPLRCFSIVGGLSLLDIMDCVAAEIGLPPHYKEKAEAPATHSTEYFFRLDVVLVRFPA